MDGNFLVRLLQGCPALEKIVLVKCRSITYGVLRLSSVRLRYLKLELCYNDTEVNEEDLEIVVSAPNLVTFLWTDTLWTGCVVENLHAVEVAKIELHAGFFDQNGWSIIKRDTGYASARDVKRMIKCLKSLYNVRSLTLSAFFLQVISGHPSELENWPNHFTNLKHLHLGTWLTRGCFCATFFLLNNTPNIERLVLQIFQRNQHFVCITEDGALKIRLDHLQYIQFQGVTGSQVELHLVKVLLKNAPALEEISFYLPKVGKEGEEKLRVFAKRVVGIPRASKAGYISIYHHQRRNMVANKKRKLVDMKSNLPEDVIDEILKRMCIKDVVKTSVLSKQWRYRWTSIPELVFGSDKWIWGYRKSDSHKIEVVTDVLFLHTGMISKFELNYFLDSGCDAINRWIVFLSRKKSLYHLVLAFNRLTFFFELPSSIFMCEDLRTLKFEGCILRSSRIPSQFKGFSHLTDLDLIRVRLATNTFETLVAKIPLLEKLKVIDCQNLRLININAPNLKVVHVVGLHCESINFQNTPNLINMKLSLPKLTSRLDQLLAGLHELQVIDINVPYTKVLPVDVTPQGLHITYHHLKRASLMLNIEDSSQILQFLFFCRSSPCLEILDITSCNERESKLLFEKCFWDEMLYVENILHHLKTMNFHGFIGQQHELGFSQFILLNAVVLETFNIFWGSGSPALMDNEKLVAVQKITQFQRASTTAKFT